MLVVIILNSILMFFYNYSINKCNQYSTINYNECYLNNQNDISKDLLLDRINIIFMIAYIIEFIIKVIAMGFIFESKCYLRDPWCVMDFIIIFIGTMFYFNPYFFRTFSFKLFRLLHPFRNVNISFLKGIIFLI